ncbi:hypothetical protein Tco_0796227 [Tanacetum coccineum]
MLETLGGLKANRNMAIDEQKELLLLVATDWFKGKLADSDSFKWIKGYYFWDYLKQLITERIVYHLFDGEVELLGLHSHFLKKPQPVPENSDDHRWNGSRPNGLKVARPGYYLVDAEYTNEEGFLAPFRGQSVSSLAEVVSEAAKLLGDRIKDSSAEISEGIKLDVELKNKTNLISYALQKIESLTKVERFRAIRKIKSKPDSVLTFWDLKEDEREEWVHFMLSK